MRRLHIRFWKRLKILNMNGEKNHEPKPEFESFFKIGVSEDYILIRDDFPMNRISPGEFSRLCMEMFRRNEEALRNEK